MVHITLTLNGGHGLGAWAEVRISPRSASASSNLYILSSLPSLQGQGLAGMFASFWHCR